MFSILSKRPPPEKRLTFALFGGYYSHRKEKNGMLKLKAQNQLEYFPHGFGFNCDYEFPFLHTHDYWEFDFVRHDISHQVNGNTDTVYANSIVIVKPQDEHLLRALPSKYNPNKAPTHLNVKVTCEKLRELLGTVDERLYGLLEKSAPITKHLHDDSSVSVLNNFLSTLLWNTNTEHNLVMLRTAVFLITSLCYREIYGEADGMLGLPPEINEIVTKLNSKKYLGCPISEIAAECNYSYMQLTRLFRKSTGMTMQDYFQYVKLEYAANQLRLTKRLVLDISNDIGISSLSHFNHIFKKRFGVTPGEYRKQNDETT